MLWNLTKIPRINEFSKISGNRVNIEKSIVIVYTSNKQLEYEIWKKNPTGDGKTDNWIFKSGVTGWDWFEKELKWIREVVPRSSSGHSNTHTWNWRRGDPQRLRFRRRRLDRGTRGRGVSETERCHVTSRLHCCWAVVRATDREITIVIGNMDVFVNADWSPINLGSGENRT